MKKTIQIICLFQFFLGVASAQGKIEVNLQQCNTVEARLTGLSKDAKAQLGYAFWLEREIVPGIWSMQERAFSLQPVASFKTPKVGVYRVSCTVENIENDGVERASVLGRDAILTSTIQVRNCDGIVADERTETVSANNFVISPNPAKDVIRFFMKEGQISEKTDLIIMDATGRIVLSEILTDSDQTINVSRLESGTYFAQVRQQNSTIYQQQLLIIKSN